MGKYFEISFDKDGNQLAWEGYAFEVAYKKENYVFDATLLYDGFSRGRSSLNIKWKDQKTGKTYESGMKLLDETCLGENLYRFSGWGFLGKKLMIKGSFTFKKQGTAILLTLAP